MNKTLVILSTVSVQQYIFRSNKLKENVGASWLVKHILEDGLLSQIPDLDNSAWLTALGKAVKAPANSNNGEVVYLAGGNAVLLFNDKTTADNSIFSWSKWLLEEAPGLRVAVGMAEIAAGITLQQAFTTAVTKLEQCSNSGPANAPLPALPLVRTCAATGAPASGLTADHSYISRETAVKRKAIGSQKKQGPAMSAAEDNFAQALTREKDKPAFTFPLDFEQLGGSEGESRLAVVHIDGNDMGQLLQSITKGSFPDDNDFLAALRSFAANLKNSAFKALADTLQSLNKNLVTLSRQGLQVNETYFPLRPLVYGGDDITFVCDGRLGVSLAANYLKNFQKNDFSKPDGTSIPFSACAGIAIIPTKYPFARAYHLAESLCANAKRKRLQQLADHGNDAGQSWLDFQVVYGSGGSLQRLRDSKFKAITGENLLYRPWPVNGSVSGQLRFEHFQAGVNDFNKSWPRSIAKDFKEALVNGPEVTEQAIAFNNSRNRKLPHFTDENRQLLRKGWAGSTTPYFDCLEMMDSFLALAEED